MAHILVIDDNAVIRDVVRFTLQYRHSVTLANDGKEGLALTQKHNFNLVITDVSMPDISGLDVVKELRQKEAYQSIPILVLTANLGDYREKIKEAGATGWIEKPFEPDKLLNIIDDALRK